MCGEHFGFSQDRSLEKNGIRHRMFRFGRCPWLDVAPVANARAPSPFTDPLGLHTSFRALIQVWSTQRTMDAGAPHTCTTPASRPSPFYVATIGHPTRHLKTASQRCFSPRFLMLLTRRDPPPSLCSTPARQHNLGFRDAIHRLVPCQGPQPKTQPKSILHIKIGAATRTWRTSTSPRKLTTTAGHAISARGTPPGLLSSLDLESGVEALLLAASP